MENHLDNVKLLSNIDIRQKERCTETSIKINNKAADSNTGAETTP
jgi:hypothetical protein